MPPSASSAFYRWRPRRAVRAAVVVFTLAASVLVVRPAEASPFSEYSSNAGLAEAHADVFRLYWAFFDREPDVDGARYWVQQTNQCTSLTTIAWSFEESAEFRLRYGTLSGAELVELLYSNVLDRPSDPQGAAYWLGLLSNGTLSRPTLVLQFSLSAEFRASHPLPSDGRAFGGCTSPSSPTSQASTIGPQLSQASATGRCDPNYSGCVPLASDVDCAGGRGNGPAYLVGTARVIGTDIYRLDGDGNGVACDGVR